MRNSKQRTSTKQKIKEEDDDDVEIIGESSGSAMKPGRPATTTTTVSSSGDGLKLVIKRSSTEKATPDKEKPSGGKKDANRKTRKAKAILSSSEEDEEEEEDDDSDSGSDFKLTLQSSDEDEDEKVPRKKTAKKVQSSDEDEDEKVPRKKTVKKERNSDSSSDSDVVNVRQTRKRGKKQSENGKGRKLLRVKSSGSEESEEDDEKESEKQTPKSHQRKNIRKMMGKSDLTQATLDAQAAERERKKRITQMQEKYNHATNDKNASSSGESKPRTLILEQDEENGEALVEVHEHLFRELKPHQIDGVRFLFTSIIESVKKLDSPPGGCILAHCMGLGKTLQVISFLHTVLTNESIGFRTALVLAPVNVVLNWKYEIDRWMGETLHLQVWELTAIKNEKDRLITLENWQDDGGVMIMGYDMFRSLGSGKTVKKEDARKRFAKALLDPGPDIVVCDEGHILKNEKTGISQVISQIKTPRRICLTGTPLQNNLGEYHCMVQFVKPNLLGSKMEFKNRFENPIKNGQCMDSTLADVRLMKQRAHVLHSLLDGCVHRRDYAALTSVLPPRQEYVISVRLSDKQIELYRAYLANVVGDLSLDNLRARRSLFADFQILQRVWTHPMALYLHQLEVERRRDDEEQNHFIDDDDDATTSGSSSGSEVEAWSDVENKKKKGEDDDDSDSADAPRRPRTRLNPGEAKSGPKVERPDTPLEYRGWWNQYLQEDDYNNMAMSGKLVLLFEILKKCEEIGDKLLVFSQSLVSLEVIEKFLAVVAEGKANSKAKTVKQSWTFGIDYFRIDGSTTPYVRKKYVERFNNPLDFRARLFLISTKAGSLGTNLVGANRVVIFDANWNPSHDVQAIFRVYRYGQIKPVYIYRFIAQGTMEERIYDRQVTKLSLALRVVDEQQIERHFSADDLEQLYKFEPVDLEAKANLPKLAPPKDLLLGDVMLDKAEWFVSYHEHDSLLQHMEEESLTEEEKETAWNEYKAEREGRRRIFTAAAETVSGVGAPPDSYQTLVALYPQVKHWVETGNRLVMESGEVVNTRLEEIVATWLNAEPTLYADPIQLLARLQALVNQLETVVQQRKAELQKRLVRMNADHFANRPLYRATPSGNQFPAYGQSSKE